MRTRIGIVGLLASASLVVCGDNPPSSETQANEVARLEAHVVPVVAELEVRSYLDEGSSCNAVLYRRYGPFDARVRSDFDRVKAAIAASEVDTHRFDASFTADGAVGIISFWREDCSLEWNWLYLYDPDDRVTKDPARGASTYTSIKANWWLVTEVDD